jgi:hypothetical protein
MPTGEAYSTLTAEKAESLIPYSVVYHGYANQA